MDVIRIYFQLLKLEREILGIPQKLWWKLVPGTTIKVPWPTGWTEPDHLGNQFCSTDPNIHYRPWLEKEVGRQRWAWDWDVTGDDIVNNLLTIRFRFDKKEYATLARLKWA